MSKNILFCADGTWNGPAEDRAGNDDTPYPTNVFKLFQNLLGADATEIQFVKERERLLTDMDGKVLQHAKYLHGVGDSKNHLARLLGGALGTGLIARIVRGYTFLSRNYAEADRIFIIGFSRGAYTARALAGLIAEMGLLDANKIDLTDKEHAYKLGASVWYAQRRQRLRDNTDWLGKIEEIVEGLPELFTSPPLAGQLVPVQIAAVAVWDTVGAYGIPEYNIQQHTRIDSLQFADRKLSPKVSRGFHAVAIDEIRADFTPSLWDSDPDRITQALFVGAHGDVGGGYPETADGSGLSDGPLKWMTAQLALLGVRFRTPPAYPARPDARAALHSPWLSWDVPFFGPRAFPSKLSLSGMVLKRAGGGDVPIEGKDGKNLHAPYRPTNLSGYLVGETAAPGVIVVPDDETADVPSS